MTVAKGVGIAIAIVFTALGLWTAVSGTSGLYTDLQFLRMARQQYEQQQKRQAAAPAPRPAPAPADVDAK